MSFDTLKCDQCDLRHWQLPRLYSTTENGEIVIMMYPKGSEPFQRQMGYPASMAVKANEFGSIQSFFCRECHQTSEIPDVDEHYCHHCNSKDVVDLSGLEGKICPKCKTGKMIAEKPLLSL